MIDLDADVFVQMKHLHTRPLDIRRTNELVEELDMGDAGRGDDTERIPAQR